MLDPGVPPRNHSIIANHGSPWKGNLFFALVFLITAPVFLAPIQNPDLFWGFSAAHQMLSLRAFPRTDFLSFTKNGVPWIDFEWLSQIIFFLVYHLGSYLGLLFLKAALLLLAWVPLAQGLEDAHWQDIEASAVFLFWAATSIAHSDLRPELFSLIFFATLIVFFERRRLNRENSQSWKWILGSGALFMLWANLHAGFILGEGLFVFYAASDFLSKDFRRLGVTAAAGFFSAAATLINPYGWGPYRVAMSHLNAGSRLTHSISEWGAFHFSSPANWPVAIAFLVLGVMIVSVVSSSESRARHRQETPAVLLAMTLAGATLIHRRFSPYFIIAFIFAAASFFQNAGWTRTRSFPAIWRIASVLCALYLIHFAVQTDWRSPLNARRLPVQAATFIKNEKPAFSKLRVYNEWEWGGYLGWELRPWFKVYCDGRYIFHDLLFQLAKAVLSPKDWQEFLKSQNLAAALMPHLHDRVLTTRIYPDRSSRKFYRPWYLFYMPRKLWALVYWDQKSLLFVRRDAASKTWFQNHEYRLWRPDDGPALKDALKRREISPVRLKGEQKRHGRETSFSEPHSWSFSLQR